MLHCLSFYFLLLLVGSPSFKFKLYSTYPILNLLSTFDLDLMHVSDQRNIPIVCPGGGP